MIKTIQNWNFQLDSKKIIDNSNNELCKKNKNKDILELAAIKINDKMYTGQDCCIEILKYLKNEIKYKLGNKWINEVVITVPGYFSSCQRSAIKEACMF